MICHQMRIPKILKILKVFLILLILETDKMFKLTKDSVVIVLGIPAFIFRFLIIKYLYLYLWQYLRQSDESIMFCFFDFIDGILNYFFGAKLAWNFNIVIKHEITKVLFNFRLVSFFYFLFSKISFLFINLEKIVQDFFRSF